MAGGRLIGVEIVQRFGGDGVLHGHVLRVGQREIFIGGPGRRDVIHDDVIQILALDIHCIAGVAFADKSAAYAQMADDHIAREHLQGAVLDADALPWRGLSRDRDIRMADLNLAALARPVLAQIDCD